MINGLYAATSGLLMQQQRMDTISNNLSNVNTTSFKKDTSVFSLYRPDFETRDPQIHIKESHYNKTINSHVQLDNISTDHERGHFKQTGNTFDLAIEQDNAYFALDTAWGVRYTRNGEFTMNNEGELITTDGQPLLSAQNPGETIVIPQGETINITEDGTVYANGVAIDALMLVEFDEVEKLQKVGRNQFTAVDMEGTQTNTAGVQQGVLEASNVNAIGEMVKMIDAARGYEMYAKVIQTHDDTMQKAASEISSVS